MGLRGQLNKGLEVVRTGEVEKIPEPSEDWLPSIVDEWEILWRSPLAAVMADIDEPALYRLFYYRNDWERCRLMIEELEDRWVKGSRNEDSLQPHPVFKRMEQLEKHIRELEKHCGLDPASRVRLDIELGTSQLTWHELTQRESKVSSLPVGQVIEIN